MANRIKEFRIARGLTVRQLSILSGYSHNYISEMENNKRNYSNVALKRIAEALEVQPQKLICPCCSTNSCSSCHYNNYRRKFFINKK